MRILVLAVMFGASIAQAQTPSAMRQRMNETKGGLTTGSNATIGGGSARVSSDDAGLPWPSEGHAFTLTEINEFRKKIVGQIVWVRLEHMGTDPQSYGEEFKVFVADPKSSGMKSSNYQYVYFPKAAAEKLKLLGKTTRGSMSFYVRVEPMRLTAVARSKVIDSFTNTFQYTW